ncbi:hypothetical protein D3C87_1931910 [compost metagenome]
MRDVRVARQFCAQSFEQALPLKPGVFQQALFFNDLQHGASDPTGQRVTAEGAAVAARREEFGRLATGQARANRHAVAKALGQSHDVRDDAFVLEREPLAGAADAGLDFIEHQQP